MTIRNVIGPSQSKTRHEYANLDEIAAWLVRAILGFPEVMPSGQVAPLLGCMAAQVRLVRSGKTVYVRRS